MVRGIRDTITLPRNAHFFVSILLRQDALSKKQAQEFSEPEPTSDGTEPLFVRIVGPALNITYIDRSFEERKLYSFNYWERNYEIVNGDADATLQLNHNAIVVVQDFDPDTQFSFNSMATTSRSDPESTFNFNPLIELETNIANPKNLFVGKEVVLTSHLSERSIQSVHALSSHIKAGVSAEMEPISFTVHMEVLPEVDTLSTSSSQKEAQIVGMKPLNRFIASSWKTSEAVPFHTSLLQQHEGALSFDKPGNHEVHVRMEGEVRLPDGRIRTFARSSIHTLRVLEASEPLTLTQSAIALQDLEHLDMLDFYIPIESWRDQMGKKFRAYAEVWGYNASYTEVTDETIPSPVAFISGITYGDLCPEKVPGSSTKVCIKLKLSKQWISRANVSTEHFQLHNVYIQEAGSSLVLAQQLECKVGVLGKIEMGPESKFTGEVTERMLIGPRPSNMKKTREGKGTLVISHGYCADDVPFKLEDFTNYIAFQDFNQNRNNDEFAMKLYDFIANHPDGPFERYSFVAHSQGGLASTHLVSFYWTGADNFPESEIPLRIIQSVGSPYRGTAIAGYIATLGRILGIACGSQFDLQHTGAQLWLSLIPKVVRKNLYYTTTTWDGNYSYCSLPLNSILTYKNDGVCENQFAEIEHANPVHQNLQGWCHIDTMRYPSQCQNSELNKKYNELAPR